MSNMTDDETPIPNMAAMSATHGQLRSSPPTQTEDGDPVSQAELHPRSLITMEELELFRMLHAHLENKGKDYNEFLKTIHLLYTSGVCDAEFLVQQIEPYIGDDAHLFHWFKSILGLQETRPSVTSHLATTTSHAARKQATNDTKAQEQAPYSKHDGRVVESSPSYRYASKAWKQQLCSGRDALCHEVLNDEYVCHPIWQREDSDFPATKKNLHEQEMHLCEEERHKYDAAIDNNTCAIAYLESITSTFVTGSSAINKPIIINSITKAAIRRVYNTRALEVVDMLKKYPAQVAPIVIKRLRQKGAQWKQAQYDLLPVWRERDARNFFRALDYAALTFRTVDRKATTTTKILEEIKSNKGRWTFDFGQDIDVMKDVAHIILSYAARHHVIVGRNTVGRDAVPRFLQKFLPWLFGIHNVHEVPLLFPTPVQPAAQSPNTEARRNQSQRKDPTRDGTNEAVFQRIIGDASSPTTFQPTSPIQKHDPRHGSGQQSNNTCSTSAGETTPLVASPASSSIDFEDAAKMDAADTDTDTASYAAAGQQSPFYRSPSPIPLVPSATTSPQSPSPVLTAKPRRSTCIFCSEHLYCFLRYYQIIYERLLFMKQRGRTRPVNTIAKKLNLVTDSQIDSRETAYQQLLKATDKLFARKTGPAKYEEKLRSLYSVDAYLVFTIDRLATALIKTIIAFESELKEPTHNDGDDTPVFFQECDNGITRQLARKFAQKKGLFEINVDIPHRRLTMTHWSTSDL